MLEGADCWRILSRSIGVVRIEVKIPEQAPERKMTERLGGVDGAAFGEMTGARKRCERP